MFVLKLVNIKGELIFFQMNINEKVKKSRNPLFFPGYIIKKLWERRRQDADNPKLQLQLENHLHPSLTHAARWLEYVS